MRVLHVTPTIGPHFGGSSVACIELCEALSKIGIDTTIFTTTVDEPEWARTGSYPTVNRNGVTIRFFPTFGPDYYWLSPQLFRALSKEIPKFDVVHIHSLYRAHLPVTVWYCRKYGVPYVLKPHGSLDPYLFGRRRFRKWPHEMAVERPAFANASAIHFTSEEEMELASRTSIFSASRAYPGIVVASGVVIPEGVVAPTEGASSFLARFPELAGKRLVLFLGRINFKKGLDILARAFGIAARRYPDIHLVVVGPDNEGYAKKVRAWLREENALERTTFTGMLTGTDKTAAYRAASVFVLPSYTENFGISIVEAMSLGIPVVISDKVNIHREIRNARAGLVVSCDALETATAIARVLDDPAEAELMARRGNELVRSKFTWDAAATEMANLYRRLIDAKRNNATQDKPRK